MSLGRVQKAAMRGPGAPHRGRQIVRVQGVWEEGYQECASMLAPRVYTCQVEKGDFPKVKGKLQC